MSFVNLNEVFLPNTGGTVNGDVEVEGAMTVNTGNGDGTTYDVAAEIAELKSAWDSVSQSVSRFPVMRRIYLEKATLTINLINPVYRGVILLAIPHNQTNAAVYILGVDVSNSDVSINHVGGTSGYTPSVSYNDKIITLTFNTIPWGVGFVASSLGDFNLS